MYTFIYYIAVIKKLFALWANISSKSKLKTLEIGSGKPLLSTLDKFLPFW